MKEAPKKLSEAIDLALEDLEIVEAHEDYEIYMGIWHRPSNYEGNENSKCMVCFAGAVMSVTHQVPWGISSHPDQFNTEWNRVFQALDDIRIGNLWAALHRMGKTQSSSWVKEFANKFNGDQENSCLEITSHYDSPKEFRADMMRVSAALKKENL